VLCFAAAVAVLTLASPAVTLAGRGNGPTGTIYVTSQGLYFDTIGLADLPDEGPFQTLIVNLDSEGNIVSAVTEYGPGDEGYVGGRWEAYVFDVDGNLVAVRHFECPLLGPGRDAP
jgi:hypothetical protein